MTRTSKVFWHPFPHCLPENVTWPWLHTWTGGFLNFYFNLILIIFWLWRMAVALRLDFCWPSISWITSLWVNDSCLFSGLRASPEHQPPTPMQWVLQKWRNANYFHSGLAFSGSGCSGFPEHSWAVLALCRPICFLEVLVRQTGARLVMAADWPELIPPMPSSFYIETFF